MHKLSVIVVNYKVKDLLLHCLSLVEQASVGMDVEVFVVDNASGDGSAEAVAASFPTVKFIQSDENVGFAKANNIAIRESDSQYVLLLNPDLFIQTDTLKLVCEFADKANCFGALGVRMVDGNGVFLPESKRNRPSLWNSFCKVSGFTKLFPKSGLFASYYNVSLKEDEVGETDVLAGAFMLLNRALLKEKTLLPECYFMYGEDVDLSVSIIESGLKNYYYPVTVTHLKGESTNRRSKSFYNAFYGSMSIYYDRHSKNPFTKWIVRCLVKLIIKIKSIGATE